MKRFYNCTIVWWSNYYFDRLGRARQLVDGPYGNLNWSLQNINDILLAQFLTIFFHHCFEYIFTIWLYIIFKTPTLIDSSKCFKDKQPKHSLSFLFPIYQNINWIIPLYHIKDCHVLDVFWVNHCLLCTKAVEGLGTI